MARGFHHRFAAARDGFFDFLEPGRDILEIRKRRCRPGEMRRQAGDLQFEVAHEFRVDGGKLGRRLVDLLRNVFQAGFEPPDGGIGGAVGPAAFEPLHERREAGVDRAHDAGAVQCCVGLAPVDLVGNLVQTALEFAEQLIALFERVALAAFEQSRQHVETLLYARKYLAGVGDRLCAVDLVGDDGDLAGEALDGLVRH